MEFLRGKITETAANTYTEVEISAPTSRSEKLAMLIWQILFQLDLPTLEDGESNFTRTHLANATSQTPIHDLDDDECLHRMRANIQAGAGQGSLSEYLILDQTGPEIRYFAPPLLYAKDSLFLAIEGTGNPTAKAVQVQVGYTLERVPPEMFIAALVE